MTESNDKIIKKIRGLLAIARDNENAEEESQSAFLMAQKLMLKYSIDEMDISDNESGFESEINTEQVTIYKKLFWWERNLSAIIANNFRVKCFTTTQNRKTAVKFYGFGRDLQLAKEMYILAYDFMVHSANRYAKMFYRTRDAVRNSYMTKSIKASYIQGFLAGLNKRFDEQVAQLKESYEVLVLIPEEVEQGFTDFSQDFGTYNVTPPPVEVTEAEQQGYKDGKHIDFTKSTIEG